MPVAASFLGVDLGASSGRVVAAHWDGSRFQIEELHRFANSGVVVLDQLCWDVLNIWNQILDGLRCYSSTYPNGPAAIGVDAWGIDFGLLDVHGRLIANPTHYRDRRTHGIPRRLFEIIDERSIFDETGVQSWHINTLFQLYSMVLKGDRQLDIAETFLTIPDLFSYFLSGTKAVEFTEATTTQMFAPRRGVWAADLIRTARIPAAIMPAVVRPCSQLGVTLPKVSEECQFSRAIPVVAVAAHDTASAAAIPYLDEESMFVSSGTWSLVGQEVPSPNTSEEAFLLGFTNEGSINGRFLLLKNLAGLWIAQECIRCWEKQGRNPSWTDVIEAASYTPAFRSLMDPNDEVFESAVDMPSTIQSYCSRTRQPVPSTIGELARAAFESLALSYRKALALLERLSGRTMFTIRIVGGGSQNILLCQMVADACNRTVVAGPKEATVLGNVVAQAVGTGHLANFTQARSAIVDSFSCETYHPRSSVRWDEAFERFEKLCALSEVDRATDSVA
jgi:rhamnulokinase